MLEVGELIRLAFQSAFACSICSLEEETKFQLRKRSPSGSPPSSMTADGSSAAEPSRAGRHDRASLVALARHLDRTAAT